MGRVLTVRLHAVTYNEEDVFRAWPELCALAWPTKGELSGDRWRPRHEVFAAPVAAVPQRYGVADLVRDLLEEYEFGDWDSELQARLREGIAALRTAGESLDRALENWQPQAANAATNDIEDALDRLQKELRKH